MLEKFFKNPVGKSLIAVSFISFIVSLGTSFFSMLFYTRQLGEPEGLRSAEASIAGLTVLLAIGGFITGVVTLVFFAYKNFSI
jgi:small-conductance mechanosensitive channel